MITFELELSNRFGQMMTKKPFQLSRGCSIAFVLTIMLILMGGACLLKFSQLPNNLGDGLGRGGRIANILISAQADHRERLALLADGTAVVAFLDKPGIFDRAQEITLSSEEWQAVTAAYQEWCTKKYPRSAKVNDQAYEIGVSCSTDDQRYIVIPEAQLSPTLLQLFKRSVLKES